MTTSLSIRQPCPPGACICEREPLLETPGADLRILSLTRSEEKRPEIAYELLNANDLLRDA